MEEIKNLNKEDFKSDGIARVIENSLNSEVNRKAFKVIHQLRKDGYSFQRIADALNEQGIRTRRGNKYFRSSVQSLYYRFSKYYDGDSETFKEGIVEIDSKKAKSFGKMTVQEDGYVVIETNYAQFKSFIFIEKESASFQESALDHLRKAFTFADNRILVSNLLHIRNKHKQDFLPQKYFIDLESVIKGKELDYIRALQIPGTVWKPILERGVIPDPQLPIESIIISSLLLSDELFSHIKSCIASIGSRFQLYIYKVQRPHSTFATVDGKILIEEEQVNDIGGYVYTTGIKIYRTNDNNNDIGRLISSRTNSFYQVSFSRRRSYYDTPIDPALFLALGTITRQFNNQTNSNDFESLTRKYHLYKFLDKSQYLSRDIFKLIKLILKVIQSNRENIDQYSLYPAYKDLPINSQDGHGVLL